MGYQSTFPLSLICSVSVSEAATAVSGPTFNLGLILGSSTVIPSYGTDSRVITYSSTTAMLSAGFATTDPEYIAAQIVFDQAIPPSNVAVGRLDETAIATLAIDGRTVTDGIMSSTVEPTEITSATADFTSADVGLAIRVVGAGVSGADLVTTIASITSESIAVLSTACSTSVTAAQTSIGAVGSGYAVNDTFSITQSGASYGVGKVLTIGTGGVPKTISLKTGGTSYSVANGLSTVATTGVGTGLEVNITALGETPLLAITACRATNSLWYDFVYPEGTSADHLALAEWAAQTDQNSYYVYADEQAADITTAATDIFTLISAQSLGRNFGVYTTTQSSAYPNNPYAAAAVLGQMMGRNTGESGSAFSLFYKTLAGVAYEPIDDVALANLTTKKGNAYISIANSFYSLWPGVGGDGKAPDEQLFLDYLVSNIQYSIGNVFTAHKKIPQTDTGQQFLVTAAKSECVNMQDIGFIAPSGVWTGDAIPILGLSTGDSLPLGYKAGSALFSTQSTADHAAFKMMPIYIAFIEAGSGRSVSVTITVQR
jgi:hypothetical protein